MIGAFVADSLGSLVEFSECEVQKDKLDEVMTMPGGGPHKVGPGQITDDSEMAMCLLHALANTKKVRDGELTFLGNSEKIPGKGTIDMNSVGKWYKKWICDEPFDLGITTSNALQPLRSNHLTPDEYSSCAKFRAAMSNRESASNGCLMRCTPMAIWTSGLSPVDLMTVTKSEV